MKKAYTLIEILASFTILSIGLIPIMSMYSVIFNMDLNSEEILDANIALSNISTYIRAKGYKNLLQINSDGLNKNVNFILEEDIEKLLPSKTNCYNFTNEVYYYSNEKFETDFTFGKNRQIDENGELIENYNQDEDIFKLNLNRLDLKKACFKIILLKTYFYLDDLYIKKAYKEPIILARIYFGWGKEDESKITEKENEISKQILILPEE